MRRILVTAIVGLAGLALALGQTKPANEESAVRAAVDSYTSAFNNGNLDGVMAHVAPDADFIDDGGKQYKGKADLTEVFKRSLADLKGSKLKSTITSIRFMRPDVAVVDGKADVTAPDGTTDSGRFTSTWTKSGDKWLLSCERNLSESPEAPEPATAALHELEWLIGNWTHEDPSYRVQVNGRWTLNKSFLVLEYAARGKDGSSSGGTRGTKSSARGSSTPRAATAAGTGSETETLGLPTGAGCSRTGGPHPRSTASNSSTTRPSSSGPWTAKLMGCPWPTSK
jgi:uncharacterized protein (TIGR02246 family)